jgi:hypothetical protein
LRPALAGLAVAVLSVLFLSASVSVAPNASLVSAEILRVEQSGSPGRQSLLRVRVISSKGLKGLSNFTEDKIGRSLDLHTKEDVSSLKVGDLILAEVKWVGGERGGLFWATGISRLEK